MGSIWPEVYSRSNSQFKLEANPSSVSHNPHLVKIPLSPVMKALIALTVIKSANKNFRKSCQDLY